jgi:hypothetical protein
VKYLKGLEGNTIVLWHYDAFLRGFIWGAIISGILVGLIAYRVGKHYGILERCL